MTGRTVYHTATSLDGFVAAPGDDLGWLLTRDVDPQGPLGIEPFMAGVGAILMGGSTYRWLLAHGDATGEDVWPYAQPAWVLTSRPDLPRLADGITFAQGDVRPVHAAAVAAAAGRDVWVVGGGPVAAQVAEAGLLDEVVVSIAPVTLGAGAPLLPAHVELRLEEVARNREFAVARYAVVR